MTNMLKSGCVVCEKNTLTHCARKTIHISSCCSRTWRRICMQNNVLRKEKRYFVVQVHQNICISLSFFSLFISLSLSNTHTQKQESKKLLSAYFLHTCTVVDLHFIETLTLLHSIHLLIFVSLLF